MDLQVSVPDKLNLLWNTDVTTKINLIIQAKLAYNRRRRPIYEQTPF